MAELSTTASKLKIKINELKQEQTKKDTEYGRFLWQQWVERSKVRGSSSHMFRSTYSLVQHGLKLSDSNKLDEASSAFSSAIAMDPNDEEAWIGVSIVLSKNGEKQEAIR